MVMFAARDFIAVLLCARDTTVVRSAVRSERKRTAGLRSLVALTHTLEELPWGGRDRRTNFTLVCFFLYFSSKSHDGDKFIPAPPSSPLRKQELENLK